MVRYAHSRTGGFAILEILIAVVVLTVLAVGLVGGESGGRSAAQRGFEETAALGLLQQRIEELRADPGSIPLGERPVDVEASAALLADARALETARFVEPGLVEVEVTLRWRPRGGDAETERALTTWIAREEGR